MKNTLKVTLCVLCGLLLLSMPFLISSPSLLSEVKWDLMEEAGDETGDELELDFGRLLFSGAKAEDVEEEDELIEEDVAEGDSDLGPAVYELPLDFTLPPKPAQAAYTENGYGDESIRVTLEEREENGVTWELAFVQIASPTQLRTATALSAGLQETYLSEDAEALEKELKKVLTSTRTNTVSALAKMNNAVIAIGGDNLADDPNKTTFEYRMTYKIRSNTNYTKDILVIDENGDFHMVKGNPDGRNIKDQIKAEQAEQLTALAAEHAFVNAFTFGPALVIDGQEQEINQGYGYHPTGKEPRAAIGQMGHLSYVLVIAKGRGSSAGVTQQELAHFLAELGCQQAFNLDGGNSAEMYFNEQIYKGEAGKERALSDIIYFATAIPEE